MKSTASAFAISDEQPRRVELSGTERVLEGVDGGGRRGGTGERQWQLAAVATFSLAVAMAVGILGLSAANTMLLLPLAARDPGRLVAIYSRAADRGVDQISYPDLEYYRANNHVFSGIAASPTSVSLSIDRSSRGRGAVARDPTIRHSRRMSP